MTVIDKPDVTRLGSRVCADVLRHMKYKRVWSSLELTKEFVAQSGVENAVPCQPSFECKSQIEETFNSGMQSFMLQPPCARGDRVIIYLHGGGWVRPITKHHWRFVDSLCMQNGLPVYVPIYPEFPNAQSTQTVQALWDFYQRVAQDNPHARIVLMGDSAGAQLCLVLAQMVQRHALLAQTLDQLILISAPCDLSHYDADARRIEKTDPMLSLVGVEYVYEQWARGFFIQDVSLDPMQAHFEPPLVISHYIGTNDLLYPNALRFDEKCMKAGVDIKTYVFADMYHVFPLTPILQARTVRGMIAKLLS